MAAVEQKKALEIRYFDYNFKICESSIIPGSIYLSDAVEYSPMNNQNF